MKFATAMDLPNWTDGQKNWTDESLSICLWQGICCNYFEGKGNRVTEIHVERNGLRGSFPPTFINMDELLVVNVHCPDSSQLLTTRRSFFAALRAFLQRHEMC